MIDFNSKELFSVTELFPDVQGVYICPYYREQRWHRFTSKGIYLARLHTYEDDQDFCMVYYFICIKVNMFSKK